MTPSSTVPGAAQTQVASKEVTKAALSELFERQWDEGITGPEFTSEFMRLNREQEAPLETNELRTFLGELYERDRLARVGTLLSEVEPEEVEWLWDGRIPLGKLTIRDGDPGLGKSVATMDLAARVTTGRPFPDGSLDGVDGDGGLGGVVILSAEDGLADTIRPRLDAAGADTRKVLAVGHEDTLHIPEDIPLVETAIKRVDAKLVTNDPVMAFLSPKVNANSDQEVRQALKALKEMAERTRVAVLLIRHMNKKETRNTLYRGGGSIGIIGAARMGLVVEKHPDDPETRVLAVNKVNLAMKAKSLTYSITTADNKAARVVWGEATSLNAEDILSPDASEEARARAWLREVMADGPVLNEVIRPAAEKEDIAYRTLERAKSSLGVKSKKEAKKWAWCLPDDDRQDRHVRQDRQDGGGGGLAEVIEVSF